MKLIMGLPERFWAKTRIEDTGYETECLVWTAYKLPNGYGRYGVRHGYVDCAHRVAYRAVVGPIADGLVIDHLCRTRACVNPSHLEPVTNRVNILRGDTIMAANAAKTHCPQGHEYTPENTIPSGTNGLGRSCRKCTRVWSEARNARRRAERGAAPMQPRTHCKQGHLFDDANTHVRGSDGARICRTCANAASRRHKERRRSANQ